MTWTIAGSIERVQQGRVVVKAPPRQVAVFATGDKFFAVDNRCPHEGYPLAEGTIDGECVLTCNWHNWKFRLDDGECILGGDHVRAYATKVEGGQVWVDLSDPPREWIESRIMRGLRTAYDERDFGRICREISRLHYEGLTPREAVVKAIEWSHDRLEFGTTHAYAAAADWLQWASMAADWEDELICLAEVIDHMAWDALRHPEYSFPQTPAKSFDPMLLESAIEDEDRPLAEQLVEAAIRSAIPWSELEPTFARAALAHYNDFGHSLIYVQKMAQLIEQLGPRVLAPLVRALTRHLCYTTREDLVPEFQDYAPTLESISTGDVATAPPDKDTALFAATTKQALDWVAAQWGSHQPIQLFDKLLTAISRNLLHYDMGYDRATDRAVQHNVGWLHLTHGITFSNAVRYVCTRYPSLWPQGLLQMACMLGRGHRYLNLDLPEDEWFVSDAAGFFQSAQATAMDHGFRDPIFSAHLVKTTVAVQEEAALASPKCARYLLAGLNRFLNSPIKQKHVRRLAHQAVDLVKRDYES